MYLAVFGLLDGGLLIAALVRGTFIWVMPVLYFLQAEGIASLFFPDAMYRYYYGFLIKKYGWKNPGDYYYFSCRIGGYLSLICGTMLLATFTFLRIW